MKAAAAVLVAAGRSQRMGFDKLQACLGPRPVWMWSAQALQDAPSISEIVLVCAPGREGEFDVRLFPKISTVVPGGAERADSVLAGLDVLEGDRLVAVHDAARPLATTGLLEHVLEEARRHGAAAACSPVTDSLHRTGSEGFLSLTVDRHGLQAMQTPQAAWLGPLQAALTSHRQYATDEVSALIASGQRVFPVMNSFPNPKVTFPGDLDFLEALIAARSA
jgi:2-C-methyl-D-erythritol 4-phosphate cytidylyltransferase